MKIRKLLAGAMAAVILCSALTACDTKKSKKDKDEEPSVEETTTVETSEATTETTVEETEEETVPAITETVVVDNSFQFTDKNFPTLDGSTSMKPLGIALLQVLVGKDYDAAEAMIDFHRTTKSFDYLVDGDSDLLLVANPNSMVFDMMDEKNFKYDMEEIAVEGLVFMVNSTNPVDSLTIDQIKGIYTGEITNWSEVGGLDLPIAPFQRNDTSGSQVMMIDTVMGDTPMMEAPTELVSVDMGDLIDAVRGYDNQANAIGYTVYYYAANMEMADGLKIIKVEGVEPSESTLASGEYPLLSHYYAVMKSTNYNSSTKILFDWLVSDDGKELLRMLGYVPV